MTSCSMSFSALIQSIIRLIPLYDDNGAKDEARCYSIDYYEPIVALFTIGFGHELVVDATRCNQYYPSS